MTDYQKMKKVRKTFYIPESVEKMLEKESAIKGISMSYIVSTLIKEGLGEKNEEN